MNGEEICYFEIKMHMHGSWMHMLEGAASICTAFADLGFRTWFTDWVYSSNPKQEKINAALEN